MGTAVTTLFLTESAIYVDRFVPTQQCLPLYFASGVHPSKFNGAINLGGVLPFNTRHLSSVFLLLHVHAPLYSRCTGACICTCALRQTPHGHMRIGVLVSVCVCMYSVCVLRLRNTFPVSCTPYSGVHCRATRPQHTCSFIIAAYAILPFSLLVQATKYEHPNVHIRFLKARVAYVLVDHVPGGRARSVADLRQQCAAPNGSRTLCLLMGQRARNAGFILSDNINNRANFSDFERLLHPTLLVDQRYIKLNVMDFVGTALGVNIVVWVPGPVGDIIVHRPYQVSIGRSTFCVHPHTQRLHHCHIATRYFALYGTFHLTSTATARAYRALRQVSTHLHRNCPRLSTGGLLRLFTPPPTPLAPSTFTSTTTPDQTIPTSPRGLPPFTAISSCSSHKAKAGRKVTSSRLEKRMGIESAVPRVPLYNLPHQSARLRNKCCSKKSSGRGQRGTINVLRWDLVLSMCPSNSKLGLRMHVIPRTVVITENVVEHHKHVHSQPSPLLAQARRKRYRKQQQQASADKQAGFLNLMDSAAAENKPAPAPDNRPHRGDNKHLDPRKMIQ